VCTLGPCPALLIHAILRFDTALRKPVVFDSLHQAILPVGFFFRRVGVGMLLLTR
jgi:hypothetical protein